MAVTGLSSWREHIVRAIRGYWVGERVLVHYYVTVSTADHIDFTSPVFHPWRVSPTARAGNLWIRMPLAPLPLLDDRRIVCLSSASWSCQPRDLPADRVSHRTLLPGNVGVPATCRLGGTDCRLSQVLLSLYAPFHSCLVDGCYQHCYRLYCAWAFG
jgi:hypothetical protein